MPLGKNVHATIRVHGSVCLSFTLVFKGNDKKCFSLYFACVFVLSAQLCLTVGRIISQALSHQWRPMCICILLY